MMKILITVCFLLIATGSPLCHAQFPEAEVDPASETAIKIFSLENADATECVSQLKELDPTAKIVADPRTNSVIVSSSNESQLRILEALVLRLDEKPSQPSPTGSRKTALKRDVRLPPDDLAIFKDSNLLMEVESLPEKIAEKESVAVQLAETIRKHKQTPDGDPGEIIESRKRLEAVLAEALELKFLFERMQLAAMEERISRIKSHFEQRKKAMKLIVDRRARELIEGDASRWTPNEFESAEVDPKSQESEKAKQKPTAGLSDEHAIRQSEDDVAADALNDSSLASPIAGYRELSAQLEKSIREEKDATFALIKLKSQSESVLKHRSDTTSSDSTREKQQTALELAMRRVESARLNRNSIQDEFAATMKDLEVLVEAAKVEVKGIERKKKRLEELHLKQVVNQSEVDEVQDKLKQAQLGLERLRIRFDLYQKAAEYLQAYLSGSKIKEPSTITSAPLNTLAEESTESPRNKVGNGSFPGNAAATTPKVPETYEQCAEIFRTSTNFEQLRAAVTTIAKLRNYSRAPTEQENSSLASSILIYLAEDNTNHAPKWGDVLTIWQELDISVKFAAILKLLCGTNESERLVAVNYAGRVFDFFDQPEFSKFCEELLKLGASPNVELRVAALRALAGTLPTTKLNSADFKSAERQEMVSRMKTFVPRQKVMELMGNAMSELDVERALFLAYLVEEYSESIDDQNVITKAIEVLFQIAQGKFANSTTSYDQRSSALIRLKRFHSRPKEIVPKLMELLKSDKSDLSIADPEDLNAPRNSFSREAIISALAAFEQEAKDALPLLEDELTLVKIKGQDGNAKKFLEEAIQKISGPRREVGLGFPQG